MSGFETDSSQDMLKLTDDNDEDYNEPSGKRLDPVGADMSSDSDTNLGLNEENHGYMQLQKQPSLLDSYTDDQDQELLTSSLIALTSHFAQMQLRVTQIVESPAEERDELLKNLEEFAFRGIPEELGSSVLPTAALLEKQRIIIDELKNKINLKFNELDYPQLTPDDLRKEVGSALGEFVGPLKMKEKLVTQLKTQIVDLERFIEFLQDDNPRLKKNLANTTHQNCDCNGDRKPPATTTGKMKWNFRRRTGSSSTEEANRVVQSMNSDEATTSANCHTESPAESLNDRAYNIMQKAQTIMQMFGISPFGCGVESFKKNSLKKKMGNHWGDIRAQLEIDVQDVLNLVSQLNKLNDKHRSMRHHINNKNKSGCSPATISETSEEEDDTDSDDTETEKDGAERVYSKTQRLEHKEIRTQLSSELLITVRKNFAITLQKLMQHGLRRPNETSSLVPFIGCFFLPSQQFDQQYHARSQQHRKAAETGDEEEWGNEMHAWELILEYYHIKNGEIYNETPARKLSLSYNLDIVGNSQISNKQSLFSAIGTIIQIHSPYKRSYNTHFKAFVSAGLNSHKLVQWLHLIFQCRELMNTYYTRWSYAASTGFTDALKTIDRLTKYDYDLPVEHAVKQFQNIKDVFM